ncbi:MAG: hydantoinase/oxoprolinase family protein [Acidimicrobiales bacterium]
MSRQKRSFEIGVDIGGTFTDCVIVCSDGSGVIGKVSSTPGDLSEGFFGSIRAAAGQLSITEDELLRDTRRLVHGTTAAINALVTGRGSRVAFLTTRGHADAIKIMSGMGRVRGASIEETLDYSASDRPDPFLPSDQVFEVTERVDFAGNVVVPFDEADVRSAVATFPAAGIEAVAISFLWSLANPAHEQRAREIVREAAPGLFVSCSHEVAPRIGEYPRAVATAMNSYVGPLMAAYIDRIVEGARQRGYRGEVLFGRSEGGLVPADETRSFPVGTLQSGPVGGVVGCLKAGADLGQWNIIVSDMGGTTLDASVIVNGEMAFGDEAVVERHLLHLRTVDVESIGAGGGSIAWIDQASGTLRVGPHSAGANPGPICYGRGGTEVTVTDADLVLGILSSDRPLAGGLKLDVDAARSAVEALGARLGLGALECAAGIVSIVDSRTEDLLRRLTIQRGHDPRDLVLWAYGGASGAHAGLYGRDLGVAAVLFPLSDMASVWSAYGLTLGDQVRTFEMPLFQRSPLDGSALAAGYQQLDRQVRGYVEAFGLSGVPLSVQRMADMKYALQVFEVEATGPDSGEVDQAWTDALVADFERSYAERFGPGTGFAEAGMTVTAIRMRLTVPSQGNRLDRAAGTGTAGRPAEPQGERPVYWQELGASAGTPVYAGPELMAGQVLEGPAICEYPDTTIVARPGQRLRIDEHRNVLLEFS